MNLVNGKILNDNEARDALERLGELVLEARFSAPPSAETVIAACEKLGAMGTEFIPLLMKDGMSRERAEAEIELARSMLSREKLEARLKLELGALEAEFTPIDSPVPVRHSLAPLGTLLHIAAGNAEGLPAFSVIEGLLTGNVNILKPPSNDGGLSVILLSRLIEVEPALKNRIFVFDIPSSDTARMKKLAAVSDALIVWGGDDAVRGARSLASPDTAIIEWGHKLSFCYASLEASDAELLGVCRNICETEQLYCSSCQGIFLDTEDEAELFAFAERFADILERAAAEAPSAYGERVRAQKTLEMRTLELEGLEKGMRIIKRKGCAVIAENKTALEPSLMFRTPWVRPLPRKRILKTLIPYKSRLQTASLICPQRDREALSELLISSGVVRLCAAERMSEAYCGMPHDGCMPLSRYVRIVSGELS
ncbi:MAG: acyl-CoA reductase [Clostridia bacterium]|nr:acyl-CoA reductase [Clostridia bacterium]